MDDALRIREFWFGKALTGSGPGHGEITSQAHALGRRVSLWFETNTQLLQQRDDQIRSEFSGLLERAARGELAAWADSPRRRLSLIILLDQFPRQIHRGTARAFEYDAQALGLALTGMQSAADAALNLAERIFFYMPLQHAESLEGQEESVSAYTRLLGESPPELRSAFESCLQWAVGHRDLIRQFGRFPHRNPILGRPHTAEELAYLKSSPDSFGQ